MPLSLVDFFFMLSQTNSLTRTSECDACCTPTVVQFLNLHAMRKRMDKSLVYELKLTVSISALKLIGISVQ